MPTLPRRASDGSVALTIPATSASAQIDCGPGSGKVAYICSSDTLVKTADNAADPVASAVDFLMFRNVRQVWEYDARSRFFSIRNNAGSAITVRYYITRDR